MDEGRLWDETRRQVHLTWAQADRLTPGAVDREAVYNVTPGGGPTVGLPGAALALMLEAGGTSWAWGQRCGPHEVAALAATGLRRMYTLEARRPGTTGAEDRRHVLLLVGWFLAGLATGEMPALWLSAGQTDALALTDLTDRDMELAGALPAELALGGHAWLIFEEPLRLDQLIRLESDERSNLLAIHGAARDVLPDGSVRWHPLLGPRVDDEAALLFVRGIDLRRLDADIDSQERRVLEAIDVIDRIWRGCTFFGSTSTPPEPTEVVDRAERRRRDRELAARPTARQVGERLLYLRDARDVRVRAAVSGSDRRVAPHWRRGHVRWVPYGPVAAADRPVRPVYVAPTLVNADLLGSGHETVRRIYARALPAETDHPLAPDVDETRRPG